MQTRSLGIFNLKTGQLHSAREVSWLNQNDINTIKTRMQRSVDDPWIVVDTDETLDQSIRATRNAYGALAQQPPIETLYQHGANIS